MKIKQLPLEPTLGFWCEIKQYEPTGQWEWCLFFRILDVMKEPVDRFIYEDYHIDKYEECVDSANFYYKQSVNNTLSNNIES